VIETAPEEEIIEENLASRLVSDFDYLTYFGFIQL
jgi:hypothetical protein